MKLSFSPASFLLLLSLSTVSRVAVADDKSLEDTLGDWWDAIKGTVENITSAISTTAGCMADFGQLQTDNPDLKTAYDAYLATYGSKDTKENTAGQQIETWTTNYGADELAAYKAACDAIGDGAVFVSVPTGTTISCSESDKSYAFDTVYNNYGDCWPTTDACAEFGDGVDAMMKWMEDEISKDDSYTCTKSDTPAAPEPTSDGGEDTPAAVDDGSAAPSDAPMDDAEPSSASKMASSVAVVAAAAVGTVMYL
jgi:hypothetical protein